MHQQVPCLGASFSKSAHVSGPSSLIALDFILFICCSKYPDFRCLFSLEDGRFFVVSEDFPAHFHNLAQCRIVPDSLDYRVHGIRAWVFERLPELVQALLNLTIVPGLSDHSYPVDLASLSFLVNFESIDGHFLSCLVLVYAYDYSFAFLHFLLVAVRCL